MTYQTRRWYCVFWAAAMIVFVFLGSASGLEPPENSLSEAMAQMRSFLKLNDLQVRQITPIMVQYSKDLRELRGQGSDQSLLQQKIGYLREGLDDELADFLTPAQQEQWAKASLEASRKTGVLSPSPAGQPPVERPQRSADPKPRRSGDDGVLQSGKDPAASAGVIW